MAKIHDEYIVNFLDRMNSNSYIGSDLKKVLLSKFPDLSDTNARKIISKCYKNNLICSSEPLTFENNQYAYFSTKSKRGYKLFKNNIQKYKPHLFRVIYALARRNGIMPLNEIYNISGATINANDHDIYYSKIIDDLANLEIAYIGKYEGIEYLYYKDAEKISRDRYEMYNDLKDKNLLLSLCVSWLERSNIIDAKQFCFLGDPNNFKGIERNNMYWDAFGFTNTIGLGSSQKDFSTIVVVDFLPFFKYEEFDFEGFKKRVERLVFSAKSEKRKVLPIIFANDFSPVAKLLIKKNNYMSFDIGTILGKNSLRISNYYRDSINKITEKIESGNSEDIFAEVQDFCKCIRENGNEVNYGNLKGTLFEYLMYPVLSKIFNKQGDRITHNFKGKVDGKEFECDYRVETENENIFIELKGYERDYIIPLGKYDNETKEINHQSVKWFLTNTFELAKKKVGTERTSKFCYITTAHIEDDAKEKMLERKKEKSELLDHFYDGDALIKLLNDYNLKNEIQVIEQFYF